MAGEEPSLFDDAEKDGPHLAITLLFSTHRKSNGNRFTRQRGEFRPGKNYLICK
ncbi:MAG: hypothetical protein JWQ49_3082, partial [Edaphobacter sp.]|nr:hypothetical protein [Edaphobacter sp.]